jgi:hypothetical protein
MSIKARLRRLERIAPQEIPWNDIHDMLVAMDQTVPFPGEQDGELSRELTVEQIGTKEQFVDHKRHEVGRWQKD